MEDRLYPREKYLKKLRDIYDNTNIIKILTGVRGSGKTSLLELIASEIRESSIKDENIVVIRLDKRPYKGVKTSGQLIELIRGQINELDGIKYIFIDEIGNVDQYETALNVLSADNDISFFVSSSNGYILKQKHISRLELGYAVFEIFTLTYDEYLDMKRFYGHVTSGNREEEFSRFLLGGSFPYITKNDIHDSSQKYTREVMEDITSLDIRGNKRIKSKEMFDAVRYYIINNYGRQISVKDMQETLSKELHKSVRKETLYNYLEILEDVRLVYKCSRFDMNSKRIMSGSSTYYLADMSLYFAEDLYNTLNHEEAVKNVVYNYARSLDYAVASTKDNIGFVLEDTQMDYCYVTVTDYLSEGNVTKSGLTGKEEKVFDSLERIRDFYPKYVLSLDTILRKRNGIKHKNIIDIVESGIKL